ncbi:MAG TPA: hypothetical protein VH105_07755, partial [Burkholderiales bacterium]|nr:hypothetical protein [Burkholderiales bacterium]
AKFRGLAAAGHIVGRAVVYAGNIQTCLFMVKPYGAYMKRRTFFVPLSPRMHLYEEHAGVYNFSAKL